MLDKKDCIHAVGACFADNFLVLISKPDPGPPDIKFNFCPYCGLKLSEESLLEDITEADDDCLRGGCED